MKKVEKESVFLNSKYEGPHSSPGFQYWTGFLIWQRTINTQLSAHELTQPLFSLLAVTAWLHSNDQICTQQEISDLTSLDRMHVSLLVKKLVNRGLITRKNNKLDKRVFNLAVTRKGYSKLEICLPIVESVDRKLLLKQAIT